MVEGISKHDSKHGRFEHMKPIPSGENRGRIRERIERPAASTPGDHPDLEENSRSKGSREEPIHSLPHSQQSPPKNRRRKNAERITRGRNEEDSHPDQAFARALWT